MRSTAAAESRVSALAIVFTDLLTGVLLGFALTLLKLALNAARLKITLIEQGDKAVELRMVGAATFLKVPALTKALGTLPPDAQVFVPMGYLSYIDHSCLELLEDWGRANHGNGGRMLIESRGLKRRIEGRMRTSAGHPA